MLSAEKLRTSPYDVVEVDGVRIFSRYHKADEFDRMARVVGALGPVMRDVIESVSCDSKAEATYEVRLRDGYRDLAQIVGGELSRLFREYTGGHNGIWLDRCHVDPDWVGEGPE